MNRILVVEDNRSVMEIIVAFIKHFNRSIYVDHVESAEEALDLIEINKYTLIITDISLVKMNGLELCLKIREKDKDVYIIGISGHIGLLQYNDLSIAGFNKWFIKPIGYADFISEVEKVIKSIDDTYNI
jgi:DNA-binding response OmpR family regulator